MCTDCNSATVAPDHDPMLRAEAAYEARPRSLIGGNTAVAREKAAIEGILDQQDISLSVLSDLADDLFSKFMPVLSNEDAVNDKVPADQPYYGSSQVFRRIQDQYNRTNNIAEKIRLLRRVAEV